MNYIFIDREMSPASRQFDAWQITTQGSEHGQDGRHDHLSLTFQAKEAGFLYIYVSNDNPTPVEVYFDDFKVTQTKSPVVQQDDYYPFGLTFNHYQKENSVQNKHLFNGGSEFQTELNLGWYSTLFRIYDPAIGRFLQMDPLADFFSGITPYNFAENNPVLYGDPSGLSPTLWQRMKAFFGIGRLSGTRAAGNQEYVKPVARNRGKPVPYNFGLPVSPPTGTRQPAPVQLQQIVEEEPEEPEEEEPPVIYFPPGPIYPAKPKPPQRKPEDRKPPYPKPPRPPFDVPRGGRRKFDAYQFEADKSNLYSTPANDKLINELIITLKSSYNIHLEIKGNVNAEPSWFFEGHQKELTSNRAKAIYDALRAAGIPASQLKASPGNIEKTGGNMSATFILTNP
ncbi:MAG TPA: RHS repeat-associated core domain-containing protein [Chryseolinea sp.]